MLFWFNSWIIGCHILAGNMMVASGYMKCFVEDKERKENEKSKKK